MNDTTVNAVENTEQLKALLEDLSDGLASNTYPVINIVPLLNSIIDNESAYALFDDEAKQMASKLWKELEGIGININRPPLFDV